MPLHNVTPTSFDHVCAVCEASKQGRPHREIEVVEVSPGKKVIVIECAAGHREGFNMHLSALDEIHPDFTDEHRHQAAQIRQLQQHLGLLVK